MSTIFIELVDMVMANRREISRPLEIALYTNHRGSDGKTVFEVPVIKENNNEPIKPILPALPAGTPHEERQIKRFFTRDTKRCLVALHADSVMGKALLKEGLSPRGVAKFHPAAAMNYWDPEFSPETEPATRIRCDACGLLFEPSAEMALTEVEITTEARLAGWIFSDDDAYCPEDHLFHPDNLPAL